MTEAPAHLIRRPGGGEGRAKRRVPRAAAERSSERGRLSLWGRLVLHTPNTRPPPRSVSPPRRSATRRSRQGGRRPRPRGAVKAVSAAAVRAAPPGRAGQEDGGGRRRRRQGLLLGRVLLGRSAGGLARQEAASGDQHHGVHPGPLLVVSGEQTAPQHHRLPLDEVAAAL